MERGCARPGCGHPRDEVLGDWLTPEGVLGVAEMGHDLDGCMHEDAADCPCPSFRTQAQQEAWERLDGVMQGDPELWPELVLDAAEKVWRAYP